MDNDRVLLDFIEIQDRVEIIQKQSNLILW